VNEFLRGNTPSKGRGNPGAREGKGKKKNAINIREKGGSVAEHLETPSRERGWNSAERVNDGKKRGEKTAGPRRLKILCLSLGRGWRAQGKTKKE